MKRMYLFVLVALTMVCWSGVAGATPHFGPLEIRFSVDGDIDGLNLGLSPGQEFDWMDLSWGSSGEGIFDALIGGPSMPEISWTQEGFEDFNVLASVGIIGSGGWGGVGILPELSLNGHTVGSFGDVTAGTNLYSIDCFNLSAFTDALEQETLAFSFDTPYANGWWDTGAVDFSIVAAIGTIENATPVPEPNTIVLVGTSLAAFAGTRIRRKKNS
ncbi:MAG: PEP-CTERM sorting domain-containing protein [Patescibacteria group bacterium]|nr:PEP-CTERM sorting domain-containing protein [Patescibacteria group bacterium]